MAGNLPTDHTYTGQIEDDSTGLQFFNARYYSGSLGRFISADTIVPGDYNPQAWNRYAYAFNNPVRYTDPSGHCPICIMALVVIGFVAVVSGANQLDLDASHASAVTQSPGFASEQATFQQWQDNCMGACHYSHTVSPVPGAGTGPKPETPLTDEYSMAMAGVFNDTLQMAGGATSYLGGITSLAAGANSGQMLIDDIMDNEFKNVNLRGPYPKYDPTLPPGKAGGAYLDANGNVTGVGISPEAIAVGRREVGITIAHEEMHYRILQRGWGTQNAEAAAKAEEWANNVALRLVNMLGMK